MTFKEFIEIEAPRRCEVHPACGVTALMVFTKELSNPAYGKALFNSTRERMRQLFPYAPNNQEGYESCLDIAEYMANQHYKTDHRDYYDEKRTAVLAETVIPDMESIGLDKDGIWWINEKETQSMT